MATATRAMVTVVSRATVAMDLMASMIIHLATMATEAMATVSGWAPHVLT